RTEIKFAEDRLKAALHEKVTLLQEIHHRVKNNMQSISSLLYLQSKKIEDEQAKAIFNECRNQVRSMALIHDKLYQSPDFINIYYFKNYINDLIKDLCIAYNIDGQKINFNVRVGNISLFIDYAVTLGLILNELISNTLKYAFPSSWKGTGNVEILLDRDSEGKTQFIYKDNGIGLPKNFDPNQTDSLGLTLVKNLAENQLEGRIDIKTDTGLEYNISFKK
ncbi:MAG: sensor histidine kinase, partial [bacterium]|nr:sensor histidine kinase [bacterium]